MSRLTVPEVIQNLKLQPFSEGGHFREFYRSETECTSASFSEARSFCTGIYFLLEQGQYSALHRIKSDEIWHFYLGDPLEIVEITPDGKLSVTLMGNNLSLGHQLTHVVKAGTWFGSRPAADSSWGLVGCTVSPGFDPSDFEMPDPDFFLKQFPQHEAEIGRIARTV